MSRTDKDMPDWVTAEWWKPRHAWNCEHSLRVGRHRCDLPAEPRREWQPHTHRRCRWEPVVEKTRRWWYCCPPARFIDHVWDLPERQRSRVDCLNAAKEYRATGEVDTVPTTRQHRHGARWLWG